MSARVSDDDVDVAAARRAVSVPRLIGTVIVVALVIGGIIFAVSNPRFEWAVVGEYLFAPPVLRGLLQTVVLTVIVWLISIVLGTVLALMRLSASLPMRWFSAVVVWVLRAVPPLVTIIFFYSIAYLIPTLTLGVPFGPAFFEADMNVVVTPYIAAVIALSLFSSAHLSEIVRAGIFSVPNGQREAAKTIGLSAGRSFFRIVVPQAMRVIIPPAGNLLMMLIHGTSLVAFVSVAELLLSVQQIISVTYKPIPLLLVASFWYIMLITVLAVGQAFLERRYGRGWSRNDRVKTDVVREGFSLLSLGRPVTAAAASIRDDIRS